MGKLKMGLIGVGGIAQERHIPAYQNIKDKVEITAAHDLNEVRAKEVAKHFKIPNVYRNYNDMFSEVDAVTICTPNKFHAEIAIQALDAGVHVLCEKPMAIHTEECEEMIEASRKANKLLSVAYHYRFMEASQIARKAVEDIGDPLVTRAQALRRRKVPGWGVFTNKELQGGGSLIDYGCHLLDLSLCLLDDPEPVEVFGTTYNQLSKSPNQVNDWGTFNHETFEVDDHVSAYIKFENSLSLLFECSWSANIKEDTRSLSISGSEGGLSVYPFEFYQPKHGKMMTQTTEVDYSEVNAGFRQAENFVESCLGKTELVVKPEQALKVTRIMDAIYQSSEIGTSVKVRSELK
ncbi:Gfo/Idh/MocA family protein [Lentibacillus salinarum]|uniref:Gfo/Idh/MocA family protein n=1 Tax=Lentibacillus salinarum TaxID=446820 RepID=A0ABW3ZUK2_9BACI